MNLLKVSNSALARYVSLDPSYISRLRHGNRFPAAEADYLDCMVDYFVKHCKDNYQKETLNKLLGIRDQDELDDKLYSTLIYEWLIVKDDKEHIESFLNEVTDFSFERRDPQGRNHRQCLKSNGLVIKNGEMHYGNSGKRKAALKFLQKILENPVPQQLYLLSEEKMDWLTDDPEFSNQWTMLVGKIIKQGNQIKIIHNINRGFDEMITAIKNWLPLYMTGAIEPYYYPRIRDRVFKKTLFIAENTVALTADTVGEYNDDQANVIYTNEEMIRALIKEFNHYLELCRPLMKIYTEGNFDKYLKTLNEFELESAETILKSDRLSTVTLPLGLVESLASNDELFFQGHEKRVENFKRILKTHEFTELAHLPDLDKIKRGKVPINFTNIFGKNLRYYNLEIYQKHLENIVKLLEEYSNYKVVLYNKNIEPLHLVYVKEAVGVLVGKVSGPLIVFAINERNMTFAFWDYLKDAIGQMNQSLQSREQTIQRLKDTIDCIERMKNN